jgi:Domain of unknown function (DUF4249)
MIEKIKLFLILGLLPMLVSNCVEPFDANVSESNVKLLVVEGYINVGPGATVITLSRVSPLRGGPISNFEMAAIVEIENDLTETFPLNEVSSGIYSSGELNLPVDRQYRLNISLNTGEVYTTEFLPVKITPPIDSISWEPTFDYINLYVSAHNDAGTSNYYQWTYREDWEIRAQLQSYLMFKDNLIQPRTDTERIQMYQCYKSNRSKGLYFATSDKLTTDRVKFVINKLTYGGEKTRFRYTVMVNQHVLTQDEYNYLILVEKNTTQTGSFFDPMPSQLFGNIHRTDNSLETIIGYIGVYTTEQQRIFIDRRDLPPVAVQDPPCQEFAFEDFPENRQSYLGGNPPSYIPVSLYSTPLGIPMFGAMLPACLDCRLRGGPKPDFWIDWQVGD